MVSFMRKNRGRRACILPKHTRPVPSSVRPSGHSQWKDPLLLTHRPFGQTPGNTSHSLTSVGKWSKQRDKDVTNGKSRWSPLSCRAHSMCNTMYIITSVTAKIFHHAATSFLRYQLCKRPQPCPSIKCSPDMFLCQLFWALKAGDVLMKFQLHKRRDGKTKLFPKRTTWITLSHFNQNLKGFENDN